MFVEPGAAEPVFTDTLELDLATVVPSLAGPARPQDRVPLTGVKASFAKALPDLLAKAKPKAGQPAGAASLDASAPITIDGKEAKLHHGSVVIAAITSCTNTSNP